MKKSINLIRVLLLICIMTQVSCDSGKKQKNSQSMSFNSKEEFADELGWMNDLQKFGGYVTLQDCIEWWGQPDHVSKNETTNSIDYIRYLLECKWDKLTVEGKQVTIAFEYRSDVNDDVLTNGKVNMQYAHFCTPRSTSYE